MKEGLNFYFGNYPSSTESYFLSSDWGIVNAQVDGGLFEENFIPEREIRETYIRGNSKPYFHGVDWKPLEFSLTFAFMDTFDKSFKNERLRELARWLSKPYYVPFGIAGDDKVFYVICVDESQVIHNGLSQGYVTVNFRCDAPWAYSKIKTHVLNGIPETDFVFNFENKGDLDILPEIWIAKNGTGEFKIVNESTGQEFKFSEILDNEQIYIHNEKEYIETDRPLSYRYDSFNNNFLRIIPGVNVLKFYGACSVRFKYQERLITI